MSDVTAIDRSTEKANIWINEVAEELGTGDRRYAYRVLRAVLHTLRDRITVQEAAQVAAQLPDLIRGVYYEGWRPSATPLGYHRATEFLDRVAATAEMHGDTEASVGTAAVMGVLREHVSPGEIDDVLAILPAEIRALLSS